MNMILRIKLVLAATTIMTSIPSPAVAQPAPGQPPAAQTREANQAMVIVNTDQEPMARGKFEPTWESLKQYEVPEWYRDAKFGIWAHWGPQCQPEQGDWYGRGMYEEGKYQYKAHLKAYGHPSTFGFKDVINTWKADKWDPERLVKLYKRAGAQYFFAMANHHDNLDLWDSKYQPWNSVAVGPKKNIIDGWAKAARDNGLKFGLSVHAAHAWSWYATSQGADKTGPYAGVPYDGKMTKDQGKGLWWEGLDPQDLYEQRHPPSPLSWNWERGSTPDQAYCDKFYNRTMDLLNKYQPDLVYYDDTALPLWPISDAGLKLAASYYNASANKNNGRVDVALFGKVLDPEQRKTMIWDIERGAPNRIEPIPWQTCTCIGSWHYERSVYDRNGYKSATTVVHTLADIVSKNGNLLLDIPVRGDGTIDEKEEAIIEGITAWMDINKEAIFSTRPFSVFGEGPATDGAPIREQGFNEGKGKPFTAADVRYTVKGDTLYVTALGWPSEALKLNALGTNAGHLKKSIASVQLLGSDETVRYAQNAEALTVEPMAKKPNEGPTAFVFKVTLK
ncbi:MAG TPA: alpha-L-fucosidase [Tepidisphaeraceae bacterium]|jgi:alpha-L-fucosidase